MKKWLSRWWEYLTLITTLLILGLFLAGHNLFGFSGYVSAFLALLGTLSAAFVSFLFATLVVPLIALITGAFAALLAAVTGLSSILFGSIFTPLAVLFSSWVSAIFTWLAGTWLGSLLMPIYTALAPIVLKISPWITVSKSASKALEVSEDHRLTRRFMRKLKSFFKGAPSKPNRSARPGQSSSPEKPKNGAKHKRS